MGRAIKSALGQRYVSVEVIVVDDCSSDGTNEYLINTFGSAITLVRTQHNSGVAAATNLGYGKCSSDYIALLGDDDYWQDPKKLIKQVQVMEQNPQVGVTGTWWVELHDGGERLEKKPTVPKSRYRLRERVLASGGLICGSTPLIAKRAWRTAGGMDEQLPRGTDSDLFRRIVIGGFQARVLDDITTVVDISHGSMRMTYAGGIQALARHRESQLRIIHKYAFLWAMYPRAFAFRATLVVKQSLRMLYLISRQPWR